MRKICTKEKPYNKYSEEDVKFHWEHPDAKSLNVNDPYFDYYECPNCKLKFSIEVFNKFTSA